MAEKWQAITTMFFATNVALNAEFVAFGLHVQSPVDPTGVGAPVDCESSQGVKDCYFRITFLTGLDVIDSAVESMRYGRPRLLNVLSLLSFFTGEPHLPANSFAGRTVSGTVAPESQSLQETSWSVTRFCVDGRDLADHLRRFLNYCDGDAGRRALLLSLLERWRKAMFLRELGEEETLEESFLAYFHVLEAMAKHFKSERDRAYEKKVADFAREIVRSTFLLDGAPAEEAEREMSKSIRSIVAGSERFGVHSDILNALQLLGLCDAITANFTQRLVQIRNAIAHARLVAGDRTLTWPLPAFLSPLEESDYEVVALIPVLVKRAIAALVGSALGQDQWTEIRLTLDPPPHIVRDFIDRSRAEALSTSDFERGAVEGVRPSSLARYAMMRDPTKLLPMLTKAGGRYVQAATATELNASELFHLSILLADAEDPGVAASARQHVKRIHERDWIGYTNIKDVLRDLETRRIFTPWFRLWIEAGAALPRPTSEAEIANEEGSPAAGGRQQR